SGARQLEADAELLLFLVFVFSQVERYPLARPFLRVVAKDVQQKLSVGLVDAQLPAGVAEVEYVNLLVEHRHRLLEVADRVCQLLATLEVGDLEEAGFLAADPFAKIAHVRTPLLSERAFVFLCGKRAFLHVNRAQPVVRRAALSSARKLRIPSTPGSLTKAQTNARRCGEGAELNR